MSKQQIPKETSTNKPVEPPPAAPAKDMKPKADALKDEMDALIEEIDGVLEKNAEQFVKDYVQRGGE